MTTSARYVMIALKLDPEDDAEEIADWFQPETGPGALIVLEELERPVAAAWISNELPEEAG